MELIRPRQVVQAIFPVLLAASAIGAQETPKQPIAGAPEDVRGISQFLAGAAPRESGASANHWGSGPVPPADEAGQVPEAHPAGDRGPVLQRRFPRYQVEAGDSFSIQFEFVPAFNQQVTVQPDGFISLREVGDLHVEGLTAPEIAAKVREKYSGVMHDPVVTVNLTDFEKPYFVVGGQVGHPGKYDLRGDTTVSQAIAVAGGFTDRSMHSQVLLFRKVSNDWMEAKTINVKKMMRAGNLAEDLHLEPGDMLYVPQNRISKMERFLPVPHPGVIINPSRI